MAEASFKRFARVEVSAHAFLAGAEQPKVGLITYVNNDNTYGIRYIKDARVEEGVAAERITLYGFNDTLTLAQNVRYCFTLLLLY